MLFNFIMLFFKQSLLFLCAIFALSSCSTIKNSNLRSGAYRNGWQVDNNNHKEYNQGDLYYYIAVAEYGDLICLEVADGNPVCFEIEQKTPIILDTQEEPYLFVTIYEPSEIGKEKITTYASLRDLLSE